MFCFLIIKALVPLWVSQLDFHWKLSYFFSHSLNMCPVLPFRSPLHKLFFLFISPHFIYSSELVFCILLSVIFLTNGDLTKTNQHRTNCTPCCWSELRRTTAHLCFESDDGSSCSQKLIPITPKMEISYNIDDPSTHLACWSHLSILFLNKSLSNI